MKTQAILILAILFCAFATSVAANASVAQKMSGNSSSLSAFDPFNCMQTAYEVYNFAQTVWTAFKAEDFGQLLVLIQQVMPLFEKVKTNCLN